ncbi:MAG TPA: hypothetical protein ENH55_16790 [Aurantimonas coralicida]|nr:hypothetical protein [Aurantimonas coralicida]
MATEWSVPPAWPGETVFILGGGPSLAGQGAQRLAGRRVIAVNSSYIAHPFADYLCSADRPWLYEHRAALEKAWRGRVVTVTDAIDWDGLLHLRQVAPPIPGKAGGVAISTDPRALSVRRTSLQAAINLAVLLGAKRIVLLGADGGRDSEGRAHHHAPHKQAPKPGCWDEQLVDLATTVQPLIDLGVEVLNASPGSHWDLWPIVTLDAVLAEEEEEMGSRAEILPGNETPTAYAVNREHSSPRFAAAWAAGCGGAVEAADILRPGPIALFGSPRRWGLIAQARAEGRTWYYADHAYFGRQGYYRVTRDGFQHDGRDSLWPRGAPERLEALGVEIKPWRESGDHVLVCPPDAGFARLFGFDAAAWTAHVTAALEALTPRRLRVRPRACADLAPLADDLAGAWCLVTYVSNAAVEALCAGVPAIVTGPCAARPLAATDLRAVLDPPRPDGRRRWAEVMAANQWTLDEIRAGDAWRALGPAELREHAA